MEALGFIQKDKNGNWKQCSNVVSTGDEARSHLLFNYHLNLIELTKSSLHEIKAEKRDISAITVGLAESKIPVIKKRIQEFRKEILEIVSEDSETERVYQMNIQFFPLMADEGDKK